MHHINSLPPHLQYIDSHSVWNLPSFVLEGSSSVPVLALSGVAVAIAIVVGGITDTTKKYDLKKIFGIEWDLNPTALHGCRVFYQRATLVLICKNTLHRRHDVCQVPPTTCSN